MRKNGKTLSDGDFVHRAWRREHKGKKGSKVRRWDGEKVRRWESGLPTNKQFYICRTINDGVLFVGCCVLFVVKQNQKPYPPINNWPLTTDN
jgi:hypothetical protein